nr:hypothetical protein [Mycolicibacterium neoaurum]
MRFGCRDRCPLGCGGSGSSRRGEHADYACRPDVLICSLSSGATPADNGTLKTCGSRKSLLLISRTHRGEIEPATPATGNAIDVPGGVPDRELSAAVGATLGGQNQITSWPRSESITATALPARMFAVTRAIRRHRTSGMLATQTGVPPTRCH